MSFEAAAIDVAIDIDDVDFSRLLHQTTGPMVSKRAPLPLYLVPQLAQAGRGCPKRVQLPAGDLVCIPRKFAAATLHVGKGSSATHDKGSSPRGYVGARCTPLVTPLPAALVLLCDTLSNVSLKYR